VRYEFGPFRLEPAERRLLREGRSVPLTPKAFDTLCALVERQGHAVSRDELMASVWPGTSVEDATLAQNILAIRKAIGAEHIETVPKFGYRFVTPVRERRSDPRFWLKWGARHIALADGANVVGRDPDVEVSLDATTVSRRHATITIVGDEAILEDHGSKNGTFRSGERIAAPVRLHGGDLVGFGSLTVTFHEGAPLATTDTQS
jgi:DNA-binding winged helix-turn-helix (wHTH) protein